MSEAVNINIQEMMQGIGRSARVASRAMARASAEQKNQALLHIAKLVRQKASEIQNVNQVESVFQQIGITPMHKALPHGRGIRESPVIQRQAA